MSRPRAALRLHRRAVYRTIDRDEGCLLDLDRRAFFSINPAGALLLEQLEHGTSRTALVRALAARFAISPARAARDTDRFLAELMRLALLDGAEPPAAGRIKKTSAAAGTSSSRSRSKRADPPGR